jgi:hypothetical protein
MGNLAREQVRAPKDLSKAQPTASVGVLNEKREQGWKLIPLSEAMPLTRRSDQYA